MVGLVLAACVSEGFPLFQHRVVVSPESVVDGGHRHCGRTDKALHRGVVLLAIGYPSDRRSREPGIFRLTQPEIRTERIEVALEEPSVGTAGNHPVPAVLVLPDDALGVVDFTKSCAVIGGENEVRQVSPDGVGEGNVADDKA